MLFRSIVFAIAIAGAASAQDVDPQVGQDHYLTYCWQCHGLDGQGNGPMAEMLAIAAPDLTRLAERNDGVFPIEAVARHIDGRMPLLAHGGEMPIFGPFLTSDQYVALRLPSGQPMMTAQPLADVVAYLESLQR